ncbi:hypothetical protein HMPREF0027_0099 [Actinobacillus ureae ATCC 25976]|uniref:Uncharacterized protein n=1 Tax=Actinobacillus ureae ATCC 25976 TaxID=887324 RepID=E8KE32_9PAST|nr:hypothetical protein HMPREF0027_0099 [Actinobacillus ureae ATCC 25976]
MPAAMSKNEKCELDNIYSDKKVKAILLFYPNKDLCKIFRNKIFG